MNTFTAKDGVSIFYKDWGKGPVVTFSHGWPLSGDAWDAQMLFLGPLPASLRSEHPFFCFRERHSAEQVDFYAYHHWAEDPRLTVTDAALREIQARGFCSVRQNYLTVGGFRTGSSQVAQLENARGGLARNVGKGGDTSSALGSGDHYRNVRRHYDRAQRVGLLNAGAAHQSRRPQIGLK